MKALFAFAVCVLLLAPVAHAGVIYTAVLSGLNEGPPNGSSGTGVTFVTVDTVAQTIRVEVTFSGLTGTTTASHIHCCQPLGVNAGVATTTPTFAGFPLGVTSASYDNTLDMTLSSSYNPSFVTAHGGIAGAEAFLFAGIAAGQAYLNIHSQTFPGGEIRGQLTVDAPEPGTFLFAGAVLAGFAIRRRRAARS